MSDRTHVRLQSLRAGFLGGARRRRTKPTSRLSPRNPGCAVPADWSRPAMRPAPWRAWPATAAGRSTRKKSPWGATLACGRTRSGRKVPGRAVGPSALRGARARCVPWRVRRATGRRSRCSSDAAAAPACARPREGPRRRSTRRARRTRAGRGARPGRT